MTTNAKAHTQEFKEGVVRYVLDHPQESIVSIAKKIGIADSTIHVGESNIKTKRVLFQYVVPGISPVMKPKKMHV